MSGNQNWNFELEEYIRQGEPDTAAKSEAWRTAIGLQAVDGLKTSQYLLETAKAHIEGKIDIGAAQRRIQSYYEERKDRQDIENGTQEADIVSSRITALLGEKTFQFSPVAWQEMHRRIFEGVFDYAGKIRTYNITKKEWVLKGDTVLYASYDSIKATLAYDFSIEKEFSYEGLTLAEAVRHIAKFISGIWQIHPFGEGNTRATAVFLIKYLKTFGLNISNDIFAENSWYFRNALVRANYSNLQAGVHASTVYLEQFFENLILDQHHELKNRFLHLDYNTEVEDKSFQSVNIADSKCKICTLNSDLDCTLDELAILREIAKNTHITQKELAASVGKSERTIKSKTVILQDKGYIQRLNGKRNGRWEILVELPS